MTTRRSGLAAIVHADFAGAAAVFAVGALLVAGTQGLPAPVFEPIGSAAFPRWVGVALMLLALAVAAGAFLRRPGAQAGAGPRGRMDLTVLTVVVTALYAAVLDLTAIGFRSATVAFTFVLIVALAGPRLRVVVPAALFALVFGVALHYVFTRFFYLDLPG
jgi:putative tricarboxylic transport membrane protein